MNNQQQNGKIWKEVTRKRREKIMNREKKK